MKLLIVLFMIAASQAVPLPDDWESFKVEYNRTFDDPAEEMLRKAIFLKNKEKVVEHNKKYDEGLVTWTMGINQFSDRTDPELQMPCVVVPPDVVEGQKP